jgi:hypothetical protein
MVWLTCVFDSASGTENGPPLGIFNRTHLVKPKFTNIYWTYANITIVASNGAQTNALHAFDVNVTRKA